ncbi:hypothetical protein DEO72_LG5g2053 [Vigna unguiculata]|uniref:Uncharacterized protein n=1 Tax=Vigna unguiculata TaxID=3917 RepID=A0A4D6M1A8_VIGUN|nr:hypothetical protein DEO72_LG5g2053 [Vigna unguiculata]
MQKRGQFGQVLVCRLVAPCYPPSDGADRPHLSCVAVGFMEWKKMVFGGEDIYIAWRLATRVCSARRCSKYNVAGRALAPGGWQIPTGGLGLCRLAVLGIAPGGCCAMSGYVHGWWLTCDDMSGEAHIQLLSCGDTSEVRRAGLRAGRFVEQDYERGDVYKRQRLRDATCGEVRGGWITCVRLRADSSPFLSVYGNDRVIRYTGADVDTGDAEDVQATK